MSKVSLSAIRIYENLQNLGSMLPLFTVLFVVICAAIIKFIEDRDLE